MSSEVLKLLLLLLTTRKEDPFRVAVEDKLLLKLLLREPRNKFACSRKEETSLLIWVLEASLLELSPLPAPQGLRRLFQVCKAAMRYSPGLSTTISWICCLLQTPPLLGKCLQFHEVILPPSAVACYDDHVLPTTISQDRQRRKPTPVSICRDFLFPHPAGEGCCASYAFALPILTAESGREEGGRVKHHSPSRAIVLPPAKRPDQPPRLGLPGPPGPVRSQATAGLPTGVR